MVKDFKPTPILITGVQRSGTTFLANLINSQDEAVIYADFLKSSLFKNARDLKIKDINKALTEREKNVMIAGAIPEAWRWNLDLRFLRNDETIVSWKDLFERIIDFLARQKEGDIKVAGVKITDEKKYIDQLVSGGIKVIYIIRDPRDVILSAKNRFARFSLHLFNERLVELTKMLKVLKNHENMLIIRYEDLILKKEETGKKLKEYLGLSGFNTDLESLTVRGGFNYVDNSSFSDVQKTFDKNAVYRWKKNPPDDDLLFTEVFLRDYIDEFGYQRLESDKISEGEAMVKKYHRKKRLVQLYASVRKIFR